jgi:hypothetical protein
MVLVSIFQRVGVLFAVLVVVEAYRLTQRDIQQAHQLPGFGLASGGGDEGFQVHFTSADRHGSPAF